MEHDRGRGSLGRIVPRHVLQLGHHEARVHEVLDNLQRIPAANLFVGDPSADDGQSHVKRPDVLFAGDGIDVSARLWGAEEEIGGGGLGIAEGKVCEVEAVASLHGLHEDVGGLDVSVAYAFFLEERERGEHLDRQAVEV